MEEMFDIFRAKAVVRRLAMRRGCQVMVMESGKLLCANQHWDLGISGWWRGEGVPIFDDEDVIFAADAELESALDEFFLADLTETVCITWKIPSVGLSCISQV